MSNGLLDRRVLVPLGVVVFLALGLATARAVAQGLTAAQGEAILNELKEI